MLDVDVDVDIDIYVYVEVDVDGDIYVRHICRNRRRHRQRC